MFSPRTTTLAALCAAVAVVSLGPMSAQTPERQWIVILRTQPGADEAPAVVALRQSQEARRLAQALPAGPRAQAAALEAMSGARDRLLVSERLRLTAPERAAVRARIAALGGRVVGERLAVAAVVAQMSQAAAEALAADSNVAEVVPDVPHRALLSTAAQSLGLTGAASTFWDGGGFTGGTVDVAVLDSGLRTTHNAFKNLPVGRILSMTFHATAVTKPPPIGDYGDTADPTDNDGHGTAVGGMVFSQGDAATGRADFKGFAYGIEHYYNLKAAYKSTTFSAGAFPSDVYAAVDASLSASPFSADPPEVYNYSYGSPATADDDGDARFWDSVVMQWNKVVAIPVGNSGRLSTPGNAFNVITVANVSEGSPRTPSRTDDSISVGSSALGPTVGGRKKPDLAAPGTGVFLPGIATDSTWTTGTGTSYAAPGIAGLAALVIQSALSDGSTDRADARAVKALLINSAEDKGAAGWDTSWGWGYADAQRAYAERANVALGTLTGLNAPKYYEVGAAAPVKATLAWNRKVIYVARQAPGTAAVSPVSNLDLALYARDSGTVRHTSASAIDNVEQIVATVPEAGVLKVSASFLGGTTGDTFGLAASQALTPRVGPGIELTTAVMCGGLACTVAPLPPQTFTFSVTVTNNGDLPARNYLVQLGLAGAAGASFSLSPASQSLAQAVGDLAAGASSTVSWTLVANDDSQPEVVLPVASTGEGYGDTLSAVISPVVGTWYLAEGASTPFFTTRIAMLNPGAIPATTTMTFMIKRSATCQNCVRTYALTIPAHTRVTVDPKGIPGLANDFVSSEFSSTITADQSLVVDRTMTWDDRGYGAHSETAVTSPSTKWYLAEGATHSGFQVFYLVQNPNPTPAKVLVRYLLLGGRVAEKEYTIGANTRENIWLNAEAVSDPALAALANTEVSADITSLPYTSASAAAIPAQPVIVERAMYLDSQGLTFGAGHDSVGVVSAATSWFLAEGATGAFFDLYLLVANSNQSPATFVVRYLTTEGVAYEKTYEAAPTSRMTIPVESERGLTQVSPPGALDPSAQPFLNGAAVSMTVTAVAHNGVPPQPLVVERAMWWAGAEWYEAHNSAGTTTTGVAWGLADGEVGNASAPGVSPSWETYVLVANTSPVAGQARVTIYFENGTSAVKVYPLLPNSRTNIPIGAPESSPGQAASAEGFGFGLANVNDKRFGIVVESEGVGGNPPAAIVVERAMYLTPTGGPFFSAGTNNLATKLR